MRFYEHIRRNINGRRRSWKSVREEKMTAALRLWPNKLYVTKDRTLANIGNAKATPLFAERKMRRDRM
jgi:hypothetical protein